jgi:RNA polymerase-binding transcription factor DksA
MDQRRCERCSQPIPAERLEAVPDATLCLRCKGHEEQMRGKPEVDDLRPRREGLPEALRTVEQLTDGD